MKQVGRELGVPDVLERSVREAGDRVRITGQLIETETGAHVWADRYDGMVENIFDLQDEITTSVVGAIEPQLRKAELSRAKRQRPRDPTAMAKPPTRGSALIASTRSCAISKVRLVHESPLRRRESCGPRCTRWMVT